MEQIFEERPIHESPTRIFRRFLRFGLMAWGGPVAQIAMIRQELVEEEKWVSREHFNKILAVYQILPGPEAHELCVHFGMMAGGRLGGFLAGLAFMLPGFLFMMLFTWLYVTFGLESPVVGAVFMGFQVAVIALIFAAVHRIGTHALPDKKLLLIAIAAFVAYFFGLPFYVVLPLAGLAYVFRMQNNKIVPAIMGLGLIAFCIWSFSPELFNHQQIASAAVDNGTSEKPSPLNIFYSGLKAGLLTFGGAYTVIPFLQQDAVSHGWLTNAQFLDGIALSGILPAPLIIFSTFVGYFGGGWLGAVIITIAIFLPAFSFTLIGFNLMNKVIHHKALQNFLAGVTAGVIGLIALTAIQLFRVTITDLFTLILFVAALALLYTVKSKYLSVVVILGAGLVSLLWFYFQV